MTEMDKRTVSLLNFLATHRIFSSPGGRECVLRMPVRLALAGSPGKRSQKLSSREDLRAFVTWLDRVELYCRRGSLGSDCLETPQSHSGGFPHQQSSSRRTCKAAQVYQANDPALRCKSAVVTERAGLQTPVSCPAANSGGRGEPLCVQKPLLQSPKGFFRSQRSWLGTDCTHCRCPDGAPEQEGRHRKSAYTRESGSARDAHGCHSCVLPSVVFPWPCLSSDMLLTQNRYLEIDFSSEPLFPLPR
nr:uncharacterized protein LOC105874826 [Microcebus murinus]XP_012626429.1 uncharacterized protein LOC105874826 [Microcebus murinus]